MDFLKASVMWYYNNIFGDVYKLAALAFSVGATLVFVTSVVDYIFHKRYTETETFKKLFRLFLWVTMIGCVLVGITMIPVVVGAVIMLLPMLVIATAVVFFLIFCSTKFF